MTDVNHGGTETQRKHGERIGYARVIPGAGAHPDKPNAFSVLFSVVSVVQLRG